MTGRAGAVSAAGEASVLEVRPWVDPVVEALGYGPGTAYVELCWLPMLGPTATLAYRRLGRLAIDRPGIRLEAGEFFASLGVGRGTGPTAPGPKALGRLEVFGAIGRHGGILAVRRALPPLRAHQLGKVPPSARAAHRAIVAADTTALAPSA